MTRGYTRGLLTFDYTQPLSEVREDYLVNYLEVAESAEIFKTKALITANLMASPNAGKSVGEECSALFKSYVDLILPNPQKSANMKEMTSADRIKIRENLREANRKLKEKLQKSKPTKLNKR